MYDNPNSKNGRIHITLMSLNSLPYSVVKVDDPRQSGKTFGSRSGGTNQAHFLHNTNGFTCLALVEERRKKKAL